MIVTLHIEDREYIANLNEPLDISIPLSPDHENPNCFYAPPPTSSPVVAGDFIGSIKQGGLLNFKNLKINPHGNGTHTECFGHIYDTEQTINQTLTSFHFDALLVSIYPEKLDNGDRVIGEKLIEILDESPITEALIIRTLPNDDSKKTRNYSGTNPPYVLDSVLNFIRKRGIKHLLIDLPSVDREEDEGQLVGHKAFWGIPDEISTKNTITEMIYVPSLIKDGLYLLQLSICSLELDVSPSKPILYALQKS